MTRTFVSLSKYCAVSLCVMGLVACRKEEKVETPVEVPKDQLAADDVPVMNVKPGDEWRCQVTVENPKGGESGEPRQATFERVRKYLGKVTPEGRSEEVDCFEVTVPDRPPIREFVAITDTEISLLGQTAPAKANDPDQKEKLIWLGEAIPFFRAGLQAGDTLPVASFDKEQSVWRGIRVIGRETVQVPAGEFRTVRLQMLGADGRIGIRKTYWFSPGIGIVKEEKTYEVDGVSIYNEVEELTEYRRVGG